MRRPRKSLPHYYYALNIEAGGKPSALALWQAAVSDSVRDAERPDITENKMGCAAAENLCRWGWGINPQSRTDPTHSLGRWGFDSGHRGSGFSGASLHVSLSPGFRSALSHQRNQI